MKKCTVVVIIVMILATFTLPAGAYTVTVRNGCKIPVTVTVWGEHLFWNQKDCEVSVAAGASGSCRTPTGICPKWLKYKDSYNGSTRTMECGPGLPMCRNLEVIFVENYGCRVENWSDCHEEWQGL